MHQCTATVIKLNLRKPFSRCKMANDGGESVSGAVWDICGVGSVPDDSVDHGTAEAPKEILPDGTIHTFTDYCIIMIFQPT